MKIDNYLNENIGMPMKIYLPKNEKSKKKYIYGRYYGNGYDGESSVYDEDYSIVTFVTPDGKFIRENDLDACLGFKLIDNPKDLVQLLMEEQKMNNPYYPYLKKEKNKFIKSYEYKNEPLSLSTYPGKWYERKGYLDIEGKLFIRSLNIILENKLNIKIYCDLSNVRLGYIVDEKFVVNDDLLNMLSDNEEVDNYAERLIKDIMNYKLNKRTPFLSAFDMEDIIDGIINKKVLKKLGGYYERILRKFKSRN